MACPLTILRALQLGIVAIPFQRTTQLRASH
jgi:hypothetical protein